MQDVPFTVALNYRGPDSNPRTQNLWLKDAPTNTIGDAKQNSNGQRERERVEDTFRSTLFAK